MKDFSTENGFSRPGAFRCGDAALGPNPVRVEEP